MDTSKNYPSVTRQQTDAFAAVVRSIEQDADTKKHAAYEKGGQQEVAAYYQGKADAARTISLYIPDFIYLQDDAPLSFTYAEAEILLLYLDRLMEGNVLYDEVDGSMVNIRAADATLFELYHDVLAWTINRQRQMGIYKEMTFEDIKKHYTLRNK